jgi:hypothetical protein
MSLSALVPLASPVSSARVLGTGRGGGGWASVAAQDDTGGPARHGEAPSRAA